LWNNLFDIKAAGLLPCRFFVKKALKATKNGFALPIFMAFDEYFPLRKNFGFIY
jgi:hypothetical protein